MDTLTTTIYILIAATVFSFIAGVITRNYSHVDRLWSVLPPVYVIVWMTEFYLNTFFMAGAILVILWGIRLTANFAIKGGYAFSFEKGFYGEDYRWEVLRQKIPNRFLFELFNLFFISSFQLGLVFLITLPLYYVGTADVDMNATRYGLLALFAGFLIWETIADMGQLRYYKRRSDPAFAQDKRIQLGFNTYGLWRISRHPNYMAEMAQWVVVFFYLHTAGHAWHWSGLGAATLILLFMGSTRMAEVITAGKYAAYADWQKATPPWIPFIDWPIRRAARRRFFRTHLS